MKERNALIRKTVVTVLVAEIVLAGLYYLFVYDQNRPFWYQPQLSSRFLEMKIEEIEPLTEDMAGEIMFTQDGFKGIIGYGCSKDGLDELDGYYNYVEHFGGGCTHIVFPNDSYEIYVADVVYEDIIDAWQYGWWDRDGNRYADVHGDEAAKGKPNYRYHYRFLIRKDNDLYSMEAFCNNDDARTVFSACIDSMDKWKPASDDTED